MSTKEDNMEDKNYKSIEELPLSLKPEDVAFALNVSRATAYNLVNSKGFPVIRIGKRFVIPKDAFLKWMNSNLSTLDPTAN